MKWFKHTTDASDDEFLAEVEDIFGLDGYARWWKLLEAVARQMDKSDRCAASYSWQKWQTILRGKRNKLETFLFHCQNKRKIKLKQNGNILEIEIPNLVKYRDEYSKKSGQSKKNVPPKNKEAETEAEEDRKEGKPSLPPTPKEPSFILPEWVSRDAWDGWVEMRKKIKAPLTDYAKRLAIGELNKLRGQGHDPTICINLAISKNWKSFYAPKEENQNGQPYFNGFGQPQPKPTKHQRLREAADRGLAEWEAELAARQGGQGVAQIND